MEVGRNPEEPFDRQESKIDDQPTAQWALEQIEKSWPTIYKWRKQARECDRFKAGKHYERADIEALERERRPHAAFNAAQKWIRYISGIERQSQLDVQFLPRDPMSDEQAGAGELVTKGYEWCLQNCAGHAERSRAFEDSLTRGLGWTEVRFDRSRDASGQIILQRVDGHEMLWDSRSTRQNLEDCRWIARERQISKHEAIKRWPEHRTCIEANTGQSSGRGQPQESVLISERNAVPIEGAVGWPSVGPGQVRIIEFQWYEEDVGYYFVDPFSGKDDWLPKDAFEKFERNYTRVVLGLRVQQQPEESPLPLEIECDRVLMRKYQRMVIVGKTAVMEPHVLPGKRFTFNAITGQWDDEEGLWYGFMRLLLDPQRYLTKFANQVMEIITRSAKGGLVMEEGVAVNMSEFERKWSQTGGINLIKTGSMAGWKEKTPPQLPAASIEMFSQCTQLLREVTGINPEVSMGAGAGDSPAMTMRQRQGASLLLLAQEFDALRRYRESEARTIFDFLQFVADDRKVRVGGAYDAQFIQLTKAPFFLDYDVVMDEGTRDPNVREQYWQSLKEMAPTLIRTDNFLPDLLNFAPWPASVIHLIKESMKKQAQAKQEMAAKGIQSGGRGKPTSMQELAARTKKIEADTALAAAKAFKLTEDVKSSKAKMILEAMIRQAQMESDQQVQQQESGRAMMEGASREALGLTQALTQAHIAQQRPTPKAA